MAREGRAPKQMFRRVTGADYINLTMASKKTSLGRVKLRNLCLSGKLPAFKVGGEWLVRPEDLEAYIESCSNINQN